MVNKIKYFILIFLFLPVPFVLPQAKQQIKSKEGELAKIKSEISALESQLKIKTAKERLSYTTLENYNKQSFLLNGMINKLREEEQLKEEDIGSTMNQISYIEREIRALQANYSKYIVSVYKKGKNDELAALIDAESIQQVLLRYKYLQKFAEKREKDLIAYEENKLELLKLKSKLEKEKEEKIALTNQKETEASILKSKLAERKKILASLRKDKTEIKKAINVKRSAESKIKNLIAKLIEDEERKRKEERDRLARLEAEKLRKESRNKSVTTEKKHIEKDESYDVNLSTSKLSSFAALKGKLNWPISGGKIIRHSGEDRNAKLNTVTLNYGVDIKASYDLNIKSVAEGVVSAIDWIPGYGGVIIVTHRDGFRTVYSHFSEIYVKEGDKVKQGSVLAKVGEGVEGYIVHFEIWNSRNNQNPEIWLARK
jgi:murein hydrolase activator